MYFESSVSYFTRNFRMTEDRSKSLCHETEHRKLSHQLVLFRCLLLALNALPQMRNKGPPLIELASLLETFTAHSDIHCGNSVLLSLQAVSHETVQTSYYFFFCFIIIIFIASLQPLQHRECGKRRNCLTSLLKHFVKKLLLNSM